MESGDWICPNQACKEVNFKKRDHCRKCGHVKFSNTVYHSPSVSNSNNATTNVTSKPGDKICIACNALNFSKRTKCFSCGANLSSTSATVRMETGDWTCPKEECKE